MPKDDPHVMLGAYVLGGLSAADRHRFESHLPGCERCRTELAESAAIPALLSRLDGIPAAERGADAAGAILLLDRLHHERRRRRTRAAAAGAVAACVAGAGAVTAVTLAHDDRPAPAGRTMPVVAAAGQHAAGRLTLTAKPWGTAVAVDLHGLPRRGACMLRVTDAEGHAEQAAAWGPTASGTARVSGATSVDLARVESVTVVDARNRVLATVRV